MGDSSGLLAEKGVRYVLGFIPDVHGRLKAKGMALHAAATGIGYQPDGIVGLGQVGPAEDDCIAQIELERALVLPWDTRFAIAPAVLRFKGEPYAYDMRAVLQRQVQRAERMGFRPLLGMEPEFYVFEAAPRSIEPLFDDPTRRALEVTHDVSATLTAGPFLATLASYLDQMGFEVSMIDHELGFGQYEVTFRHGDALDNTDKMTVFKLVAETVARQCGGRACFMPKPAQHLAGSGLHMNLSLADAASGKNLFTESAADEPAGRFSDLALRFTAGIVNRLDDMMAVCCPSVNSYKRLVSTRAPSAGDRLPSWAPVYKAYGFGTRTAVCRLPNTRPCVEVRHPDLAGNLYLSAAMVLAAGLDGIESREQAGPPLQTDTQSTTPEALAATGVRRVASTLDAALDDFERSAFARRVFGEGLFSTYLTIKRAHCASFFHHVTDWEHDVDV